MQDGVVYRGISPDVLMIDRKGRLQVGFSGGASSGVAYFQFFVGLLQQSSALMVHCIMNPYLAE